MKHTQQTKIVAFSMKHTPQTKIVACSVGGSLFSVANYCNQLGLSDFLLSVDHTENSVVLFKLPIDWPCDARGPLPAEGYPIGTCDYCGVELPMKELTKDGGDHRCPACEKAHQERLAAQDEPEICSHCNGSGEGMYYGTRCMRCQGTGTVRMEE